MPLLFAHSPTVDVLDADARACTAGFSMAGQTNSSLGTKPFRPPNRHQLISSCTLQISYLLITGVIFVVVFSLLVYATVRFRRRADDDGKEPAQVYGSNAVETAWTVVPLLSFSC